MSVNGLVSVIIPTYNRYDLLNLAISSVLNQTYKNIEVIVVNDCSTDSRYYDGSLESQAKVIHLPKNQREVHNKAAAQGAVRQFGIERARGEWIAFLDDDDIFSSFKIEKQLKALEDSPSCLMCSSNMYTINSNREVAGIYCSYVLPSVFTRDLIIKHNYINNSTVIVHKSILDKAGPCRLVDAEDWDLWIRCLNHTNCIYLSEPLVLYLTGNVKYYKYES
jgi:glycosyltransferase involved in cell wall biosynthesis